MDKYTKCLQFLDTTLIRDKKELLDINCDWLSQHVKDYLGNVRLPGWSQLYFRFNIRCGDMSNQCSIFSYLKSCEYAEKIVKENNESFELRLQQLEKEKHQFKAMVCSSLDQIQNLKEIHAYKISELQEEIKHIKATVNHEEQKIAELEKENQELKALVYSSLDQINSLKENKSFLSEELQIMKISFDDSLREFEEVSLDNLGEQIISLLDKFDDVKEHNKSLSSRVLDLESLFEKNETPNLINLIDL